MTNIELKEHALNEVMSRISSHVYFSDAYKSPQEKIQAAMVKIISFILENPSILNLKQTDDN